MRRYALPLGLALVWACGISAQTGSGGTGGINIGDGGEGGENACALYEHTAVSKPVNLYIMFDKSSSMAGNKWDQAKAGLSAFLQDDGSSGLDVALRFFPRPADATPECDQQAYKEPTVDFTPIPSGAPTLIAAIDAEAPDGFSTPIYPALGGALLEGIEVASNNPGEVSAVLLVTDGAPQQNAMMCAGVDPEDPQAIADLAATGAAFNPPVATYVVGLPGVDQAVANQIADAGGTTNAILVGATNVEAEFRDALATVRGSALPCAYDIPDEVISGEVALHQVNIEVTPTAAPPKHCRSTPRAPAPAGASTTTPLRRRSSSATPAARTSSRTPASTSASSSAAQRSCASETPAGRT